MTSNTVLTVLEDDELREIVERVVAAVGLRTVASPRALRRKAWSTVGAVVLDESGRVIGRGRRQADQLGAAEGEKGEGQHAEKAAGAGGKHAAMAP